MSAETLDSRFDPLGSEEDVQLSKKVNAIVEEELGLKGFLSIETCFDADGKKTLIKGELDGEQVDLERRDSYGRDIYYTEYFFNAHPKPLPYYASCYLLENEITFVERIIIMDNGFRTLERIFNKYEEVAELCDEEKDKYEKLFEKMKKSFPITEEGLRGMNLGQWKATEQKYTKWLEMKEGLKEVKKEWNLKNAEDVEKDYAILTTNKEGVKSLKMNINGHEIVASYSVSQKGEIENRVLCLGGKYIASEGNLGYVDKLFERYENIAYDANWDDSLEIKKIGLEFRNRGYKQKDTKTLKNFNKEVLGGNSIQYNFSQNIATHGKATQTRYETRLD